MIELKVFGRDRAGEAYETMLKRAQRIAESYADQVTVNEYELDDDEARQFGVARAPALAIGDRLIYVGSVPTAGQIGAMVRAALAHAQ